MAEFLPFRGVRYSPAHVKLQDVTAPPYDVISPEEQNALYARDPHNVIRLILNRDADPYLSAKGHYDAWKATGVLEADRTPMYYVYYQTFNAPSGRQFTRSGILGRLRLHDYTDRVVLPHERTLAGPKQDRSQLLRTVEANLSPIFGLIDDESHVFDQAIDVATVRPAAGDVIETLANGESVRHTLWLLEDPAAISRVEQFLRNKQVIIADGHHRYETALAYGQESPAEIERQYVLAFLSNLRDEGTVILPTHRVLHGVKGFNPLRLLESLRADYDLIVAASREEALSRLESDPEIVTLVELREEPRWTLVKRRAASSTLAVLELQENILKKHVGLSQEAIDNKTNLLYPHTTRELDAIAQPVDARFLLRAVTPEEMAVVVGNGDFMPQKSTFFYPKLLSGLVFHEFALQR